MTDTVQPVPSGACCLKTCIYRDGDYLHAITTLVKDGNPEVFKASVDLRPIVAAIARRHASMHGVESVKVGGFWSSITATASKMGHANIVKSLAADVKASAGGHVSSTVVFPAVSLEAATAYATAKTAINTIHNANAVAAHVKRIATHGSAAAKAAAKSRIGEIKALMAKKALVQKSLASLANRAAKGDPDALKAQRIFAIVAKSHAGLKGRVSPAAAKGMAGLLITSTGRVVPGHYIAAKAGAKVARASLYDGKRLTHGNFSAV